MKVWVFVADEGGCGYYRLRLPAERLQALGHDVTVFPAGMQGQLPILVVDTDRGRDVIPRERPDCDVIVIQRPMDWSWKAIIPRYQEMGIKVVADLDDDLVATRPNNAYWPLIHPKRNPIQNWAHMTEAMKLVDVVTTSTPALAARYGTRAKHVHVIPNCVPAWYLEVERPTNPELVLGWAGTVATHPDDLDVMGPTLQRLKRELPFTWSVIGESEGVARAVGVEPVLQPWMSLLDYPKGLGSLDVGVVPLALHEFNRAKSWLKGMEMAAVGVPFVAAPTDQYLSLAELGAGLIAHKPRDWERLLRRLLTDESFRTEQSARGREVASGWTVESNAWRWEEAWLG